MTSPHASRDLRFRLGDDVVLQPAGDEALLVTLNAENVFGLNATGVDIIQRIAGGVSLEQAIDELAAAYDGDRQAIADDVRELVDILVRRGLLDVVEG